MASQREQQLMRRALELAANGPARGVNPRVGCVIVSPDGTIIGEGWHRGAGTPHAEVAALSQTAPDAARGATAIVTLEPCNHTGRTGPCVDALLDAGIARVVYASTDPGGDSSGGGTRLRESGVDVEGGVLESEVDAFLGTWMTTARLARPHVTVKWASSLDGRTAAADGTSQWITGAESRADAHLLRSQHDAIAVGTGTVLTDDPSLTARDSAGALLAEQPVPVVFGTRAIPGGARLRQHPLPLIQIDGRDLAADLRLLRERGIRSLFIEGGPALVSAFVRAGLVDSYVVYLAPALLGGDRVALTDIGVASIDEARRLTITDITLTGDDARLTLSPKGR
ncbi:bifunctional diaminohydroxyphosphoribosylaminopyrimidine deaminase/5-amino-6-(5-phosphoribosylamino)uracil reductase RibD [Paramicrobacterium agarici]|uniref:bifunctional diaminohydroxyphosphoribosylaminopyrimidine deaminase/5-amino-6-(5-phosphoribosylamino)uracil reductase RibD n=1 Tax=Paramicrobacterium agarici TaxID=630514 RepID=UPI0024822818|nr:bifunctional diaminohydroxyphosphoribosylaminopyrimidine deaminase/5-amino-6-(5-phosphoribosylamino)uracil reductase RibD [Microbacterium agarici]